MNYFDMTALQKVKECSANSLEMQSWIQNPFPVPSLKKKKISYSLPMLVSGDLIIAVRTESPQLLRDPISLEILQDIKPTHLIQYMPFVTLD